MKRTLLTSVTAFALGVMATVAYTQGKARLSSSGRQRQGYGRVQQELPARHVEVY